MSEIRFVAQWLLIVFVIIKTLYFLFSDESTVISNRNVANRVEVVIMFLFSVVVLYFAGAFSIIIG